MDFKLSQPKKDPSIYLNKVWNSSLEIQPNDPVNRYLLSRGIIFIPKDIKYCPMCWESETKQNYQSMVARITSKAGKPIGVHITYLKDGKKADIPNSKKTMTPTESLEGSAIRLTEPYEIMGIAEGIETALSCTLMFDVPTWSCISAGLMEKWTPPESCKKVVVFGDSDYSFTGQKSANTLANKLYSKGYKVQTRFPPDFGDWNNVLTDHP